MLNLLLIIDNCGGHVVSFDLHGLRVEFLPRKTAHEYQTFDLGLMVHLKIRYRSTLRHHIVHSTLQWNSGEHNFPATAQNSRWGVIDGYLPDFGDPISMFNDAWAKTECSTILKCWTKSQCISSNQVHHAHNILHELNETNNLIDGIDVVETSEVQDLYTDLCHIAYQFELASENPMGIVLSEMSEVKDLKISIIHYKLEFVRTRTYRAIILRITSCKRCLMPTFHRQRMMKSKLI